MIKQNKVEIKTWTHSKASQVNPDIFISWKNKKWERESI